MAQNPGKIDRYSVYGLVAIAVVVVIGGVLQFRSDLFTTQREVFDVKRAELIARIEAAGEDPNKLLGDYDENAEELIKKQQSDSDGDGLTDFDEEFIYNTSPYLSDSDSDGISDGDELTGNTNPNCPEGQPCSAPSTGGDGTTTAAESAYAEFIPAEAGVMDVDLAGAPAAEELLPRKADGSIDTDAVRDLLRQQGIPDDVINEASDEDLILVAEEAARQAQGGANAIVQIQDEIGRIRSLSVDEKRAFLVESGLSQSEVDALPDDLINEIIDEATAEAANNAFEGDQDLVEGAGVSTDTNTSTTRPSSGEVDRE